MDQRRPRAERRLQRDLQELACRSWELPTVSALPLEDNLLEWHCNIVGSGDHEGVVLHLKLLFPPTYPHQPPEVVLMSKVCHPHVFDDHVCLDMLEEGQWSDAQERDAEFTGWSTCYSVFSILMQLQAFLFDLGNNADRTRKAAGGCECFCGHGVHRVYPPLPEPVPPPPRALVAKDPFLHVEEIESAEVPSGAEEKEVSGRVSRVERYGVFVHLDDGRAGLLRYADMQRGLRVEVGDPITCRVKEQGPRLSLTMWRSEEELAALAGAGLRIPGTVRGVKPFGVFVDLGGTSALLHRSEMDLLPQQPIPWELGDIVHVRLLGRPGPKAAVTAKALFLRPAQPRQLLDGTADLERLHCFHSKATFQEAVLGVGVGLEEEDVPGGQPRYHLSGIYDTLAHDSFQDGVRRGVWKQKFSEFLPLAVDAAHFGRARRTLEASVARLASGRIAEKTRSHGKSREERDAEYRARVSLEEFRQGGAVALERAAPPPSLGRPADSPFTPEMILDIVPKLMNSQVVLLSSGQLWRCEKALEGYFAYHHLLLHCLGAYPALRNRVESTLASFCEKPEARCKNRVPNIGELLCWISVSEEHSWAELGIPILEEVFDRNVLWILKQAPHLGELSDAGASQARLRRSFAANRTSLRLLMFQVAFLQLVKPLHVHETGAPPCHAASCALERKDRCKGLPGPGEVEWLFARCLEILDVEDFHEFLELVGAAPMDDAEISRWLRRSVLHSITKDYHNPRYFRSLLSKPEKAAEGGADPEDFGLDTRPKLSKAAKRARRQVNQGAFAAASAKQAEYTRALSWARFHSPHGYQPRQTCLFLEKGDLARLEAAMGTDGKLKDRFMSAVPGYRLLDGASLEKVKRFPAELWLGSGCAECGRAVTCEISGRCMPCCHKAAKEPAAPRAIKGLVGAEAPVARFTAFQAMAVVPVEWEVHLDVGFAGLVADVAPLRAVLAEDLTVTQQLWGGLVFSRVERAGKRLWEKSPEQVIFPGSRLIAGWEGVTDAVFQTIIRGMRFTLLKDTMHEMTSLEDVSRLKMARTSCKDHVLRDEKTKELIWDRPCRNCRGVLRLRFAAPRRYAERRAQLESLGCEELARRAQLCGLLAEVQGADWRKETVGLVLKAEQIIR